MARFFIGCLIPVALAACQGPPLRLQSGLAATRPAPKSLASMHGDLPARPVRTLTVGTFNAGLAVGVLDYAPERAPLVARALAEQPFDLLCVQEFWHAAHWQELATRTAARLPERVRPEPQTRASEPCSREEILPVATCVMKQCGSASASELAMCAMRHCESLASSLSPSCLGCLTRDPLRTAKEILAECVPSAAAALEARRIGGASEPAPDSTNAAGKGADSREYFYGGSYGIGLLSGMKILESEILPLESTQNARAIIYARVKADLPEDLHVFCTHLTPLLRHVPYPGKGSWEAEQAKQVDVLLDYIQQKTGGHEPTLLLGDLNTGPARLPGIVGSLPEHYAKIISVGGFFNAFVASDKPECTFCYDNPITGDAKHRGLIIDHVLARGLNAEIVARRMLDEPLELMSQGRRVTTAYSDHYGLVAEIRLPAAH